MPDDEPEVLAPTQVDTDSSGTVDQSEMFILMRALGTHATPTELRAMIKEVDIDGDGEISFDEFMIFMSYKVFDGDGSGRIVYEDLEEVSQKVRGSLATRASRGCARRHAS